MPNKTEGALCQLTGIRVYKYTKFNKNLVDLIGLIQKQEYAKIMINIDSYFCPWHRGYGILHISHWCLINKYLVKDKIFVCDDPFYKKKNCQVSLYELQAGLESFDVYVMENNEIVNVDMLDVFQEHLKKINIYELVKDLYDFANRILLIKNVEEFFDYQVDVYLCSIFRTLKFIGDMRYNMSYLFSKFYKLYNEVFYKKISDAFESNGQRFENINCNIMKLYFCHKNLNKVKQGIYKILLEIIANEELIYQKIYYWFQ